MNVFSMSPKNIKLPRDPYALKPVYDCTFPALGYQWLTVLDQANADGTICQLSPARVRDVW